MLCHECTMNLSPSSKGWHLNLCVCVCFCVCVCIRYLLWTKLPPTICWSPHSQSLRMWHYLKLKLFIIAILSTWLCLGTPRRDMPMAVFQRSLAKGRLSLNMGDSILRGGLGNPSWVSSGKEKVSWHQHSSFLLSDWQEITLPSLQP